MSGDVEHTLGSPAVPDTTVELQWLGADGVSVIVTSLSGEARSVAAALVRDSDVAEAAE